MKKLFIIVPMFLSISAFASSPQTKKFDNKNMQAVLKLDDSIDNNAAKSDIDLMQLIRMQAMYEFFVGAEKNEKQTIQELEDWYYCRPNASSAPNGKVLSASESKENK